MGLKKYGAVILFIFNWLSYLRGYNANDCKFQECPSYMIQTSKDTDLRTLT